MTPRPENSRPAPATPAVEQVGSPGDASWRAELRVAEDLLLRTRAT